MPYFAYQAKDAKGSAHKGSVEAANPQEAAKKLRGQGLWVTQIKASRRARMRRVPDEQVARFYYDLADLLDAGLPLDRALTLISANQTHKGFQVVVRQLVDEVTGGGDLSSAMGRMKDVFGELASPMLKAGESSGALAPIVRRMGQYVERRRAYRQALISALIYPAILLLMSVLSVIVLLVYVIPRFAEIFENLQQQVPFFTQLLLDAGKFLQEFGAAIPLVLLVAYLGLKRLYARPENRLRVERRLLAMPVIGKLLLIRELSRFCLTLGAMLTGGVQMLRSLTLVEGTIGNVAVREMITPLKGQIKTGGTMSDYFRARPIFPPRLATMLRIAEEQGSVGEGLLSLGEYFENEFQLALRRFMTFLEPMVIIVTGSMIGVMVLSMFTAIFGINDIQF